MCEFCIYAVSMTDGEKATDAYDTACTKGVRPGRELDELLDQLAQGKRTKGTFAHYCYMYKIVVDEALAAANCDWRNDLPGDTTVMPDGSLRS